MRAQPAAPIKGTWQDLGISPHCGARGWRSPLGIQVLSGIADTDRGPERHISISVAGKRPTPQEVVWAREAFGADDWERDDHSKWLVSFWQPINADMRGACECGGGQGVGQ